MDGVARGELWEGCRRALALAGVRGRAKLVDLFEVVGPFDDLAVDLVDRDLLVDDLTDQTIDAQFVLFGQAVFQVALRDGEFECELDPDIVHRSLIPRPSLAVISGPDRLPVRRSDRRLNWDGLDGVAIARRFGPSDDSDRKSLKLHRKSRLNAKDTTSRGAGLLIFLAISGP